MKAKYLLVLSLFIFCLGSISALKAQDSSRSCYLPIWTFHQRNIDIYGVSLGFASRIGTDNPMRTNTNGIKAELIGVGMFVPFAVTSPTVHNDSLFALKANAPLSEVINGLNISPGGSICHSLTNGILAGGVGQIFFQVNGLAAAPFNHGQKINGIQFGFINSVYELSGVQIGLFMNASGRSRAVQIGVIGNGTLNSSGVQLALMINSSIHFAGIQIGLVNHAEKLTGLQIGLWNINQDRSSPIINWSF